MLENFLDEQSCSETSSDDIDVRAASEFFAAVLRLQKMVDEGPLAEVGSGPRDPYRMYILKER